MLFLKEVGWLLTPLANEEGGEGDLLFVIRPCPSFPLSIMAMPVDNELSEAVGIIGLYVSRAESRVESFPGPSTLPELAGEAEAVEPTEKSRCLSCSIRSLALVSLEAPFNKAARGVLKGEVVTVEVTISSLEDPLGRGGGDDIVAASGLVSSDSNGEASGVFFASEDGSLRLEALFLSTSFFLRASPVETVPSNDFDRCPLCESGSVAGTPSSRSPLSI